MNYAKDDVVRITIGDIGTDGEGIGKIDGYTLFVKDAVIGDVADVKIIKAKKNYGYARLMNIVEASPDRVKPACLVARQCGGCQIQQMSYSAQLDFKRRLVENNLRRIGGFEIGEAGICVAPVIGMDEPYHYRNKAQYPVGMDKDGRVITGFYAGRTHHIIDNVSCMIGAPENAAVLETIKAYITENNVSVYDEASGKGAVRHILIRKGFHTGEIMVCVVANADKLPHEDKLVQMLTELKLDTWNNNADIPCRISSIILNANEENTNVILGSSCRTLWGKDYIEDSISGVRFQISPLSFYQVNPVQTEKLYAKAVECAGLTGSENVWDMYCGIGTISLIMAGKAKHVTGVEIVPQAIDNAKNNALLNGIDNAEFHVGKAEEVAPQLAAAGNIPDVIVVDPPRKGCDEALLDTIIKMSPQRVVYVSCDSATLARDLRFLCDNGYGIDAVQPYDQFCHSVHVETVCLLSNRKSDSKIRVDVDLEDYYKIKASKHPEE